MNSIQTTTVIKCLTQEQYDKAKEVVARFEGVKTYNDLLKEITIVVDQQVSF